METKAIKEEKVETWKGSHNGFFYEIKRWVMDGCGISEDQVIWNSYIYVRKSKVSEKVFKAVNLRWKKYKILPTSPVRISYDYYRIEDVFKMMGGITWYSKERDELGNVIAIKVGNDYNHIWNTESEKNLDNVRKDVMESIDCFVRAIDIINKQ